jgi:hypothetical protein
MKHYEELYDDAKDTAVEKLNEIEKSHETKVLGYQIARYESTNEERTYILVEVSE